MRRRIRSPARVGTGEPGEAEVKDGKDPRYQDKSPHTADEQDQPAPERPVTPTEKRLDGPEDKPSQAEGERDESAE